jgi:hypothetical protein
LPLHIKWSVRVQEEFFEQGDDERQRGLPISPWMDRTAPNLPKSQIGFLNFLCVPLFEAWTDFLHAQAEPPNSLQQDTIPCLARLLNNKKHWYVPSIPSVCFCVVAVCLYRSIYLSLYQSISHFK